MWSKSFGELMKDIKKYNQSHVKQYVLCILFVVLFIVVFQMCAVVYLMSSSSYPIDFNIILALLGIDYAIFTCVVIFTG